MAKKSNRPDLSAAEWDVMKVVWRHGPLAARDVYAHLRKERDWTYATVKTFLGRIVDKGWLEYDRVGNSFLYRPAVQEQKAVGMAIGDFAQRVLDGTLAPFVAYFARQGKLRPEDVKQLEEILERHRGKEGGDDDEQ